MKKVPTFNRLLVERVEQKSDSGLYLGSDRSLYEVGKILAVGPMAGTRNETKYHEFQVGQKVVYQKTSVADVRLMTDNMLLVNDDHILAILED